MVKVIWSDLSVDDLKSIHEFISQDSARYADKMIDKIISRVDQLANFPNSGRFVPEFKNKRINLR
jgi:plasmid stabilization system protein ParE